ncbi:MAG: carbohydrate ABC transporter permease, partial [Defluviitaleaceae bacterium]|nr:carbohydrate ABC transporter permease [Defluviitaleaceae bacterium]
VSSSFSSPKAVLNGSVILWPVEPGIQAYEAVFCNRQIMTGFRNSLLYTAAGTVLSVVMGMVAAFPLSRKDLLGKNIINFIFIFTMFFSGGLIPYFLLVKDTLRLYDTPWALILPGMISVWYVILMRTYIQSAIPEELIESAELDGCSVFGTFARIIVPLSKPTMAVVALYSAVAIWSSYFEAFIFIRSQNLYPLQVVLRNILILNNVTPDMLGDVKSIAQRQGMKTLVKYSIIVVSSAPLLLVYPFVQKYFVKGIMIGSLKG